MGRLSAFVAGAAILTAAGVCRGQTTWGQSTPAVAPPARDAARLAWDPSNAEVLLFGGDGRAPQADTWSFDGARWLRLAPVASPPARAWHALATDHARQRVVLFGGTGGAGVSDELWEWDGVAWSQRLPAVSPPPRSHTGLAWDAARQELVMFGGFSSSGPLVDTWTWDGSQWAVKAPAMAPTARGWHAMAGDPLRGEVVLFGGFPGGGGAAFGDTWIWDGANWSLRQPTTSPPSQLGHALAFHHRRARVVMSPGFERPLQSQSTWEWDGRGWSMTKSGSGPIGNWDNGLAYDPVRAVVVHFGGRLGGSGSSAQTWEYSSVQPARAEPFGSGCAGSVGLPDLSAVRWPWLGDTLELRVTPVPSAQLVLFVFGLSDSNWAGRSLPTSLAPEGMPGCVGHVSVDAVAIVASMPTGTGDVAEWTGAISPGPALLGQRIFGQTIVLDAAATTPFPGVVSNALRLVVGQR
ncbi:MAG: hypothetical protein NXI31_07615 [bacterium]|nr:hypothetical protein [bacterium]